MLLLSELAKVVENVLWCLGNRIHVSFELHQTLEHMVGELLVLLRRFLLMLVLLLSRFDLVGEVSIEHVENVVLN